MRIWCIEDDEQQSEWWEEQVSARISCIWSWFSRSELVIMADGVPDVILFDAGSVGIVGDRSADYLAALRMLRMKFPHVPICVESGLDYVARQIVKEFDDDLTYYLGCCEVDDFLGYIGETNENT